jgi:hypothetical protein
MMNLPLIKKLFCFLISTIILMNGCSGTHQPFATPSAIPSATATTLAVSETATPAATSTSTVIAPASQPVISTQDKASFVSETYPDNSVLTPGQAFTKTWKINNTGSVTWTTAYQFFLSAAPQGETLGSPAQINFTKSTTPGQILSVSVPLVAPSTLGTYTVYWSIRSERGETVAVDGSNLWVKIQVCASSQACTAPVAGGGTTAMVSGASVTVTNFTYDAQSATVNYCIAIPGLPDWRFLREYHSLPSTSKLLIDQKSAPFLSGSSDFPSGDGCAYMVYQVGAAEIGQAQHVTYVIDVLRMGLPPGDPDVACQTARLKLMGQYTGLDFECHFSMAGYYTGLQLPSGMTSTQAQQIIMDAIQAAIYGPWILTLK